MYRNESLGWPLSGGGVHRPRAASGLQPGVRGVEVRGVRGGGGRGPGEDSREGAGARDDGHNGHRD